MLAKIFGIALYVVAGFLAYTVTILAFVAGQPVGIKAAIMGIFAVPGALALLAGFACTGFRTKLRDGGVVLLSASGFSTFVVFMFACLSTSDDFKKMMKPGSMEFFSSYASGAGFLVGMAGIGTLMLWRSRANALRARHPIQDAR
jgi:hypothetical protein